MYLDIMLLSAVLPSLIFPFLRIMYIVKSDRKKKNRTIYGIAGDAYFGKIYWNRSPIPAIISEKMMVRKAYLLIGIVDIILYFFGRTSLIATYVANAIKSREPMTVNRGEVFHILSSLIPPHTPIKIINPIWIAALE